MFKWRRVLLGLVFPIGLASSAYAETCPSPGTLRDGTPAGYSGNSGYYDHRRKISIWSHAVYSAYLERVRCYYEVPEQNDVDVMVEVGVISGALREMAIWEEGRDGSGAYFICKSARRVCDFPNLK